MSFNDKDIVYNEVPSWAMYNIQTYQKYLTEYDMLPFTHIPPHRKLNTTQNTIDWIQLHLPLRYQDFCMFLKEFFKYNEKHTTHPIHHIKPTGMRCNLDCSFELELETEPIDFGNLEFQCKACKAYLYKAETEIGSQRKQQQTYAYCCNHGKLSTIPLPDHSTLPTTIKRLFGCITDHTQTPHEQQITNHFLQHINSFNNSISFGTMFSTTQQTSRKVHPQRVKLNKTRGPFISTMEGNMLSTTGPPLQMDHTSKTRYAAVYFTPGIDEIEYRLEDLQRIHKSQNKLNFSKIILNRLIQTIKQSNPLYQTYKMMIDNYKQKNTHYKVTFPSMLNNDRYFTNPSQNARNFISVLQPTQNQHEYEQQSVPPLTISTMDNSLITIPPQHQLYEAYTFLMLHLHTIQPTYHVGLQDLNGTKVTLAAYYHFMLFTRDTPNSGLRHDLRFYCQNLWHKYLLNAFIRIQDYRLNFLKHNLFLSVKGMDTVNNIQNELQHNKRPNQFGRRVISSNFNESVNRFRKLTSSAMAVVSQVQASSLFITLTLNPKWPCIQRNLKPHQKESHRPDLSARVFRLYSSYLSNYIKKHEPFGPIKAIITNCEYQTRGNVHQHCSFFLQQEMSIALIDSTLSAELPCKHLQPVLYNLVTRFMIHTKHYNTNRLCLVNGKCRFGYPKPFSEATTYNPNTGFQLRRRNNGRTFEHAGHLYRNCDVVPYSPLLLLLFQSHLNCEYCSTATHVAYSLKYSLKAFRNDDDGGDTVFANVSNELSDQTEAASYQKHRFISSPEASYKLLRNNPHTVIWPTARQVNIHLEGNQSVAFNCNTKRIKLSSRATTSELTAYFNLQHDETASPLPKQSLLGYPPAPEMTLLQVAKHYTFCHSTKQWKRRKRYENEYITYIRHIDIQQRELYHLRLILLSEPVKSFKHARTHQGITYPTFFEAAQAKGLIDTNDSIFNIIKEASMFVSPKQLRVMFITLLINSTNNIVNVWHEIASMLSQDFAYQRLKSNNFLSITSSSHITNTVFQQFITTTPIDENFSLLAIQQLLQEHGKTMQDFNLPIPTPPINQIDSQENRFNSWITNNYNPSPPTTDELKASIRTLNDEQFAIFKDIIKYCFDNTNVIPMENESPLHAKSDLNYVFHVQGNAGMGKSYLLNILIHYFFNHDRIVLSSSPSGIAATLLYGASTMHSMFQIPLQIDDTTTLNITKQSFKYKLLKRTSLLIIDEISMSSGTVLNCLNRGLQALFQTDRPFAGIPTLIVGDCTQIPPIVPGGNADQVTAESFLFLELWSTLKRQVYELKTNIRLQQDQYSHSNFLHQLGWNKLIKYPSTGFGAHAIRLPDYLTLQSKLQCELQEPLYIQDLINWTFDPTNHNLQQDRTTIDSTVIITPLNSDIYLINDIVLRQLAPLLHHNIQITSKHELLPNQHGFMTYFATTIIHDKLPNHITRNTIEELRYPGMPLHQLDIAIGSPILLLRNLDKTRGLCNGTRLRVTRLLTNSIIAVILNGNKSNIGSTVAIPRIDFQSKHNDSSLNISFVRHQFPVTLAFAISINKSQGQTISKVGIYLPQPVFTHGMLTVALSRVRNPDNLAILIPPNSLIHGYTTSAEGKHDEGIYTPHIVYPPLLDFKRNSSNT